MESIGQYEVLTWLVKERKRNPEAWFKTEEIYRGLKESNNPNNITSVKRSVFPLLTFRYVESEIKNVKGFHITRKYRATDKALKELSKVDL